MVYHSTCNRVTLWWTLHAHHANVTVSMAGWLSAFSLPRTPRHPRALPRSRGFFAHMQVQRERSSSRHLFSAVVYLLLPLLQQHILPQRNLPQRPAGSLFCHCVAYCGSTARTATHSTARCPRSNAAKTSLIACLHAAAACCGLQPPPGIHRTAAFPSRHYYSLWVGRRVKFCVRNTCFNSM